MSVHRAYSIDRDEQGLPFRMVWQRVADYADEVSKHRNANIEDAWAKYVSAEDAVIIAAKKMAFAAGWDAAKWDEYVAEDEDIADADDVGFCEWLKAEGK